jgi:pimeloyl-ACP methyl ester carboxylesterase
MQHEIVLYFGGNGHAAVRLASARAALARISGAPELRDVEYPGFEGRPTVESLEAFLTELGRFCQNAAHCPVAVMSSGIGSLIALALRSRGLLHGVPVILQGPVLWGLERRFFPRLLRWRLARFLISQAFTLNWFQQHFENKHLLRGLDATTRAGFFAGYADCRAFGDLFVWFTPGFLRDLERRFSVDREGLEAITVWWGGQDRVVDLDELRHTEAALGVRWPLVTFPGWGHYPMIDEPEEWARALMGFLELHEGGLAAHE